MEVHHHPDLHHRPKKWKEYFLEFLMIFLAVTMGFFAESIREHLSDKRVEREYISSFVEDLKQDTGAFNLIIPDAERNIRGLDTLLNTLVDIPYTDSSIRLIYYLKGKYANFIYLMFYTTRTITQLKNAGGLRLITDKRASDSITIYNNRVDMMMQLSGALQHDFTVPTIRLANKIYNPRFLIHHVGEPDTSILHSRQKIALLSNDQSLIAEYTSSLLWDREVKQLYVDNLKLHRQLALSLITFFSKEYNLKSDKKQ